jgi:hypothetical protein
MGPIKPRTLLAAAAVLFAQVSAAQIGLQQEGLGPVALGYTHLKTDNIERIVDGNSGSYDGLSLYLNIEKTTERIAAAAVGSVEYRAYSEDELEDETLGVLAAFADFALVPERLSWSIRESFAQGATDPFAFEGPGNRESVNVFETGPELTLPLGRRMGISLAGTYSDRRFSESVDLNSELLTRSMGLFRQISPTANLSVSISNSEIEYENTLDRYEIEAVVAEYSKELASGNASVQVGRNRVVFDTSDTSGPLYRLQWSRNVTARSRFEVFAGKRITDSGALFGLVTGQIGGDVPLGVVLTSDPLEQVEGGLTYEFTGARNRVLVRVRSLRDDYEFSDELNNDSTDINIEFSRLLGRDWRLGAFVSALQRDFTEGAQDFTDRYAKLWLSKTIGEHFAVDLSVGRNRRVDPAGMEENIYAVQVIYTPRPEQ